MRRLGLLLAPLLVAALCAPAQLFGQGVITSATVVHSCGKQVLSSQPPSGGSIASAPTSQDTTGGVCISGTITAASRDSVLAKAITVHTCGQRTLTSPGNPENPVGMDTTGALCTNASGGGGGNPTAGYLDSIGLVKRARDSLVAGYNHAMRAAIDSLIGGVLTLKANPANTNNTYNPISADTAGRLRTRLDSLTGCLATAFSCPLHAVLDSAHTGTADTIYTFKGCTVTAFSCPVHMVIDSSHLGATPVGQNHIGRTAIDSLIGGALVQKATPAYSGTGYQPIFADTSGRQSVRVDSITGCLTNNFPARCPIHIVTDSTHVANYPPGDSLQRLDSIIVINKMLAIDSMQRLDSLVRLDTVFYESNGAGMNYPQTTDSVGWVRGINAADSILLPAKSGQRHFITAVCWSIVDSTTTVAAAAPDTVTTTNLPGAPIWIAGNAVPAGGQVLPFGEFCNQYTRPIVALSQNTVTKFRGNATGAHTIETLEVHYYLHP